jgi:GAF domain-containing protein
MCAVVAYLPQVGVGDQLPSWANQTLKIGGIAGTLIAVLFAARQTRTEARAKEDAEQLAKTAVTNYRLALESILLPLTELFDRIITAPDESSRMEAKGAMKQAVVNSAVQFADVSDISRVRSCYFDYDGKHGRLVCRTYTGRGSRPRTELSRAEPNHAEIFRLLEGRQSRLIENVDKENYPRFPLDGEHKTYILVPVATRAEVFGLLTLDALQEGDLKSQDEKEMLLLAQLLGIALASNGNSRGRANNLIVDGRQRFARLVYSVTRRGNSIV